MRHPNWVFVKVMSAVAVLFGALVLPIQITAASAATPPQLALNVLLIGSGPSDPMTAAWVAALTGEGVAYTLATVAGTTYGSETVTLPTLSTGTDGNFNAVVFADSPFELAGGVPAALATYESTFGVRQIDGYSYPSPLLGQTDVTGADISGTTGTLTTAGLADFPGLSGTIPFDTGTFGYGATAGSSTTFTPLITDGAGNVLAGIYQHPASDAQANVSELSLNFDYGSTFLQWLVLAPGLINWVTQDTHLGLSRNYFGQDIDDNFIADNEWSSTYQCTPAATDPTDYTCPAGVAGNATDTPPNVQMSSTDVANVVAWEQSSGIKLNLAFNGVGACISSTATASDAVCNGTITEGGKTYTLPGHSQDSTVADGFTDDSGLVDALLADKADFNWVNHTWSHEFLGCNVFQQQPFTSAVAGATGGTLAAGAYNYEITAATAYGESEPSAIKTATTTTATGSVVLTWPNATNGVSGSGATGTAGPTLAQEEAIHTGGTGFWGYNVYREDPTSTSYGYIGHVAENGTQATYTYTDTGATVPGAAPTSAAGNPTATNPGIDCAPNAGGVSSWDPAADPAAGTAASTDASIQTEIAWDQAFATANALPNYSASTIVTGEHSGIENPNMPAALATTGVNVFATDASRQPTQYSLGSGATTAESAPRYPSNIYYNASNWPDQINEYNTLYVDQGTSIGDTANPTDVGRCSDTTSTTCLAAPATEATFLASESRIMLSHVLANDPRVGYAHQTDLINDGTGVPGSSTQLGYTILALISNMQSQYNKWINTSAAPLVQMTDTSEAQVLGLQSAWNTVVSAAAPTVTAAVSNGVITVTNNGTNPVNVPLTAPAGTTVAGSGAAYGSPYAGALSTWTSVAKGTPLVLDEAVPPTILSAASATSIVGAPFSFTVATTGAPTPTISIGTAPTLPAGITFTDNGNGTATLAGTSTAGTGGSYPLTITASNGVGTPATQAFTLTNDEAPSITSASAVTFVIGHSSTYTVTTTGFPAATITETGALPAGLLFSSPVNGTATITGSTTATAGTLPAVSILATNASGSTATLALTITVVAAAAPKITTGNAAFFTLGSTTGAFAVTATGEPTPTITEVGAMPAGLTFGTETNGTVIISGTPTATGTTSINITANNTVNPAATQTLVITVGQGPAFTSATSTSFVVGTAGTFAVTTTGTLPMTLSESPALPSGLTFVDNSNGTATLSGTPATGTAGLYPITLTATNSSAATNTVLELTISPAAGSVSLGASPGSPITVGASVKLTATVPTGQTGTVNFESSSDGTTYTSIASCNAQAITATTATCTTTALPAGTMDLEAVYSGDVNYAAATSTAVPYVVNAVVVVGGGGGGGGGSSSGGSSSSSTVPTVTIKNIPSSASYGGSLAPSFSTSSDGTVFSTTSSTSSVCAVNGSTVSFVGVGTCSLTASVAATLTYPAATGTAQVFTVGQATPTVTITNMPASSKEGSAFSPKVATSGNGTVFSVSSTSTSVCTVNGSVVHFVGVGTCSLTGSVAATADYSAASSTATTQSSSATKRSVPGRPSIRVSSAAKRALSITLTKAIENGGSPITKYQYSLNGKSWIIIKKNSHRVFVVGRLTAGKSYKVRLRADNAVGSGLSSKIHKVKIK
jgi:hypothetical protein